MFSFLRISISWSHWIFASAPQIWCREKNDPPLSLLSNSKNTWTQGFILDAANCYQTNFLKFYFFKKVKVYYKRVSYKNPTYIHLKNETVYVNFLFHPITVFVLVWFYQACGLTCKLSGLLSAYLLWLTIGGSKEAWEFGWGWRLREKLLYKDTK